MMMMMMSILHLFFLITAAHFSSSLGGSTLTPSQPLADDDAGGAVLISPGSRFELCFFSPDGGSGDRFVGIRFHSISEKTVVWVANRERPIAGRTGRLTVTANGTLVITEQDYSAVVWSSAPPLLPLANPVARLLYSGNLVVVEADDDSSRSAAWESFDHPTDALLPGMRLVKNLTSGVNRNLTAWASAIDPSPGSYVTAFEPDGDPQLFIWHGLKKYWRGGPWNGLMFTGVPEMKWNVLEFDVVVDPGRSIVFSYRVRDPSMLSRFTTTYSGPLQHFVWIEQSNSWLLYGFAPRDECDGLSPCGPNGFCYPGRDLSITCECLQGFLPRNGTSRDVRDLANGCIRKTPRDCWNGTDGFVKQTSVKLPDTSRSMVDRRSNVSLEQCKALCLSNCSCTAYASANISTAGGSGCIIWTSDLTDIRSYDNERGQDLYVRVAAIDLRDAKRSHKSTMVAIILVPTAVTVIVLGACGFVCARKRRKKTSRYNAEEEKEVTGMDLPLYDLATVIDATGNFSEDNKLGQGGFGPVYKGKLADGKEIAVKRLCKTSKQGIEEFKNEMVLIAKLQHRNLVRLLGCCIQGGERMLIYEYMLNGILDALLFNENKNISLDWPTRYNIIVGVARGLLYLHQDSRFRIIHRDLKSGNVLLDKDMKPKISDFGMARIFGGEESEVNTKRVVGTYGYMSPEYAMDGIFSVKSDVFSFGVLVLEIITGRRNRGIYQSAKEHLNLIGHVWSLWKDGRALEIVDKSIGGSFPDGEVISCVKVGLLCVQERPSDRPTMSSVIKLLGSDVDLLPEPKQPGFLATKDKLIDESDSSTSKKILSINAVSAATVLEGR